MKIAVVGIGYVGLTTALMLAELGHKVTAIDIDKWKVKCINSGKSPIYEPGVEELLKKHIGKNIVATTEMAIEDKDLTFICVGTPSRPDGSIDLTYLKSAAEEIGSKLSRYQVIVVKSTVVPGTTENVVIPILERKSGLKVGEGFGIAMCPEFLREGMALYDTFNPDRIIIGEYDIRSGDVVESIYKSFTAPILRTDIKTAEMIKYASNAFLAIKISFANELANICHKLGIDVYDVMKGVGMDHRISPHFLNAGIGFGGSCFPKDVKALINLAKELGYEPLLLESVLKINDEQTIRYVNLIEDAIGPLKGLKVAVFGLSFKPNTDDVRESRAIPLVQELLARGAIVIAYDPKAMENFRKLFPEIIYAKSAEEALSNADVCVIQADWDEFKNIDYDKFHLKLIVDGRRTITPTKTPYLRIGMKQIR